MSPWARRRRSTAAAAVIAGVLLALQGPALMAHVRASAVRVNDDVCQHISPFLRPLGPGPRDVVDRFCLATLPVGYRGLYSAAATVGDARLLSRFLTYALLAVFLVALAVAARPFGGWAAAGGVCLLALSADGFLARMVGGLPRGFAFPLFALATAAAVHGRVRLLALLVPAAALFYPAMAVPAGLALLLILLLPRDDRGEAAAWSPRRRAAWLAGAALATLLAILPTVLALRPYGAPVGHADIAEVPEAGPGGRLGGQDRWDFDLPLVDAIWTPLRTAPVGGGRPWWPAAHRRLAHGKLSAGTQWAVGFVLLAGVLLRLPREAAARRLWAVTAAVPLAYLLARGLSPLLFAPQRQVGYPVPVLVLLWFAAGGGALARSLHEYRRATIAQRASTRPCAARACSGPAHLSARADGLRDRRRWAEPAGALLACALLGLAAGSRVRADDGLTVDLASERPRMDFFASLPADAFVAGWPNWMSLVPYAAERPVFVSLEAHLPFRRGYVEELRRRMRALIDATFATSPEPLRRLRDEWGVTHLLVDKTHVTGHPNTYFRPFDGWVRRAVAAAGDRPFEVLRQRANAQVYEDDRVFVLDLGRVEPGPADRGKEGRLVRTVHASCSPSGSGTVGAGAPGSVRRLYQGRESFFFHRGLHGWSRRRFRCAAPCTDGPT